MWFCLADHLMTYDCGAWSCPTLYNPMDCSPPGFSVHGTLQGGILEWVAISFSKDLPNPGIEPESPVPPALASGFFTPETLGKACTLEVWEST